MRRQGHAMFLAGFHAPSGDGPDFLGRVHLVPYGADRVAGAGRRSDRKFESSSRHTFLLSQAGEEVGQLAVGKRRMMLDSADLGRCGEQMVEMAAPPCRVLALPKPANLGPIQYRFNSAPHAVRSLGPVLPIRL